MLMTKVLKAPLGGWPNVCVEWPGKLEADGYARVRQHYVRWPVHRLSYHTFVGPIPEGIKVRHTCDNRACYNPKHLLLGTSADNSADMTERERQCRGEAQTFSKLDETKVRRIKRVLSNNVRGDGVKLAAAYNVAPTQISAIRNGRAWRHVF